MDSDRVLEMLVELRDKGELFIALTPPFGASLDIDRDVLAGFLQEKQTEEVAFRRTAHRVGRILGAILSDREDAFISDELEDEDPSRDTPAREELRVDIRKVREHLYDQHLQRRYDLKRSSKAPSFTDIDWDIKIKRFDSQLGEFAPFPYATCRLSFQREFDHSARSFFGRAFDSVQVNFSIDEIDHLSRVLAKIKTQLTALEKEGD